MTNLLNRIAAISLVIMTLPASAHVVFNEAQAVAGEFHTAQFRVTHGCEGTPTHTVTIEIPDGVSRVSPRHLTGWEVKVQMRPLVKPVILHGFEVTETVGSVTWTGGSFPNHTYEQFELRMMMPDESGKRLDFKVKQICERGEIYWQEIAKPGKNPYDLEFPAPFITLIGGPRP